MPDLTPITNWLASLGSYGPLLGVGLTLLVLFLKSKLGTPVPPAVPTPPASPATNPLALGPQFPLLNLLLQGLGIIPKGQSGTTADIPHTLISQVRSEVEGVTQAHIDAHMAALADLQPSIPSTTAAAAAK